MAPKQNSPSKLPKKDDPDDDGGENGQAHS